MQKDLYCGQRGRDSIISPVKIQKMQKGMTFRGNGKVFKMAELLGQGQFGKVYRAFCDAYPEDVAVKIIRKSKFSKNQKLKQLLQRQMEVLCKFTHDSVIQFHELVIDHQDAYLVYQYCQGGTLQDKITLNQNELFPLLEQMLEGLSHAEKNGIIHRDIKPANILLKEGKIKIADWGFSRLLDYGETTCSFIGSPAYMAPQVLKGDQYTIKADVWSLGVVLYESLTGMCPWRSNSVYSLVSQISKKPLIFPQDIILSSKLKKTIKDMLNVSPILRPSFSEIKERLFRQSNSSSTKLEKSSLISSNIKVRSMQEQQKIASCVFFLELIQWSRKNVEDSTTLLTFVKLVEKNLLKLRPRENEAHIFQVWEKEIKVVREIKNKLTKKISIQPTKSRKGSFLKIQIDKTFDSQQNPEGQWQALAKNTIKMVIEVLEQGYKEAKQQEPRKYSMLIQINLLLDLVIFQDVSEDYLKTSFDNYQRQLLGYSSKTLLKLINCKLVLINKKYYQ